MWKVLRATGIDPSRDRTGPSWSEFIRSQATTIVATDFACVDTARHYNEHRPHRALHQRAPDDHGKVAPIGSGHPIRRHATCGGLINDYRTAA